MGRPAVCLQTACRLIELALTGYALWYFAENGHSGWFWLTIAAAFLGQQGAAAVASICLRQLEGSECSSAAPPPNCDGNGRREKLASSRRAAVAVAAHCILCGDIWWFLELVVQKDRKECNNGGGCCGRGGSGPADDPRFEAYTLCRLFAAASSSVPLSIVAASAYVEVPHLAPGLCALTSAASVAVTWSHFHDYGAAVGRARRCVLRALAFVAKASIVVSRLSAVSRVASTVAGAWVAAPLLLARLAAAASFSIARRHRCRGRCCCGRRHRQNDGGDDRLRGAAVLLWRTRTAQAVRAVAYCSDLLLTPEECTRSLIATYYSLVLLESCALAVTWYVVVGGEETTVTRERLLWLAGDFASLTFGVLMTLLHCSAAAKAIATGATGKIGAESDRMRSGEPRAGDVTPATDDDYEWDPYDGDIRRRRASFTNAVFELECGDISGISRAPVRPPLAIVLPYSALECCVRGGEVQPEHRADDAHTFVTEKDAEQLQQQQQQPVAMVSPAAAGEEHVAVASDDGCLNAAAAASVTETELKKYERGIGRAVEGYAGDLADAAGESLTRACVAESRTAAAVDGDFESAGGGWSFEHNVAYLNCGFVADDEPGAAVAEDALPRYLPHAPRGVFTTRWHSASYGLNVYAGGGCGGATTAAAAATRAVEARSSGARSARTLPGVGGDRWRRNLSSAIGGGGVVDGGETKDRPSVAASPVVAAGQPEGTAAAAAACLACPRPSTDETAAAPSSVLPPLERQAAAATAAEKAPEHWVRRWLRQVVSRQKPPAVAIGGGDGLDCAPDTLF